MPRKSAVKKQEVRQEEPQQSKASFFDYLRFGESYTSLILGIIVVVISTALLLSFVHSRNIGTTNNPSTIELSKTDTTPTVTPSPSISVSPTITKAPTATAVPTVKKQPTVTTKPTVKPTAIPTKVQPTAKPQIDNKAAKTVEGKEYIVKKGDTLWSIAENHYKNGYKWVDIARVNKLSNPGSIFAGNKLILPKLATEKKPQPTVKKDRVNNEQKNTTQANKITGTNYKIMKGDTLWSIAVRAYGDGYKWVDIARANNLSNPGLIHVNNTLKLPRGK